MVDIENVAAIGALIGERARAEMLVALMSGEAQTGVELANAASITKQTASSHLAKLVDAGLLTVVAQGRHRYYRIADARVARLIETVIGVAARSVPHREFGPRDAAMRKARVCYDHLAGELGVLVHDSLQERDMLRVGRDGIALAESGAEFLRTLGIDVAEFTSRRPLCRSCLDWSARRYHLAGAVGGALLGRFIALGWARRVPKSRVVTFSATGERALRRAFPVEVSSRA